MTELKPVKIGIVGCGSISGSYLRICPTFDVLEVAACADIDMDKAKARAEEFTVSKVCTVEELLADEEIEIVVNLTVPAAHGPVALSALEAGKSIHNEKPLAVTRDVGQRMLRLAAAKGLRVGSAPDTFLGAGGQTCRRLIDEGAIGEPVAATAFMMCHGHESWHPNPDFFYKPGGGPLFDMGPYYLTMLVQLLGPVRRVTGSTRITFPERTITAEARNGEKITVETPTHITGALDFASGAICTVIMSFDVWNHRLPCIEIYGTEGTLAVPDPNGFGGVVRLRRPGDEEWQEVPLDAGYTENTRGIGVADMAAAIQSGRAHRCSAEMTYHVLDIMHAFDDASRAGRHIELESTCERPAPLPPDLPAGQIDA